MIPEGTFLLIVARGHCYKQIHQSMKISQRNIGKDKMGSLKNEHCKEEKYTILHGTGKQIKTFQKENTKFTGSTCGRQLLFALWYPLLLFCAITALAFAFCALSVEKKNQTFHLEENIIQGRERETQRGEGGRE